MTSIVDLWHKKHFGKLKEGVDKLNLICGGKRRPSELTEIKDGKRKLIDCYLWVMLNDHTSDMLDEHKYKREKNITSVKWVKFIDDIAGLAKNRDMLDRYLPSVLSDYGYCRDTKIRKNEWNELLDKLSPPKRVKR